MVSLKVDHVAARHPLEPRSSMLSRLLHPLLVMIADTMNIEDRLPYLIVPQLSAQRNTIFPTSAIFDHAKPTTSPYSVYVSTQSRLRLQLAPFLSSYGRHHCRDTPSSDTHTRTQSRLLLQLAPLLSTHGRHHCRDTPSSDTHTRTRSQLRSEPISHLSILERQHTPRVAI
jgi:hypothetical protein